LAVASDLLEHSETDENYPDNIVTLPRIKNTLIGKIFEYVESIKKKCRKFRDPKVECERSFQQWNGWWNISKQKEPILKGISPSST
jgi:alpha-L-arabinofuranosidase